MLFRTIPRYAIAGLNSGHSLKGGISKNGSPFFIAFFSVFLWKMQNLAFQIFYNLLFLGYSNPKISLITKNKLNFKK